MQAVGIIENRYRAEEAGAATALKMAGGLSRLFGCWHREMSRPFTLGHESYRVCLSCGARRNFDLKRWKMTGAYYFDSAAGR